MVSREEPAVEPLSHKRRAPRAVILVTAGRSTRSEEYCVRLLLAIFGLCLVGSGRGAEPPKVADLVRQLEATTPGERAVAAERLCDAGPTAADAIPALTRVARAARSGSKKGDTENRRAN